MPPAPGFPNVVVMNDTSGRSHHGCSRVMRLLVEGLQAQGLTVTARSPAHRDWENDAPFMAALGRADLVVINGEGTLHHGRAAGARLLAVTRHPARGRTPVALVNALWQDNPAAWFDDLARCALVATRDGQSAKAVALGLGGTGPLQRSLPDLSLSAGAETISGPRDRLIFGDAVRHSTRRALAVAARRLDADALIPTKTRQSALWAVPPLRGLLSALYHGTLPFGLPRLELARDEAAYLAALGRARMHVTGRFHALCLSLVTGTPVLAVASNSWKIEALLADAGLSADRMIAPEGLLGLTRDQIDRPFDATEAASIQTFLDRARAEARALFTELADLARHGRSAASPGG